MHNETSGSVTGRDQNAGRYRHLLRAALLAMGIGYVLTIPIIADRIIWDPSSTARELCHDYREPGLGIVVEIEPGGKFRCKLLFRRILLFWSFYAVLLLPLAAPLAALRYVMRRAADAEGPSSELQRRDKIVRIVGVGVLFLYAVGTTLKTIAKWYW